MTPLLSHKELLFESFISKNVLNESYYYEGKISFIELLLEAAIDKDTVSKMLASGKRSSVYYQGDDNIAKGWHTIEPVKVVKSKGEEYLSAYDVPKGDEKNSKLVNFDQKKIVNWNVLSSKSADLAKAYKSKNKISDYFSTSGISSKVSDFKDRMKEKLKAVGVKAVGKLKALGKVAGKVAIAAAIMSQAAKEVPYVKNNMEIRAFTDFLSLRTSTLTEKEFKPSELKTMEEMVVRAMKNKKAFVRPGGVVDFTSVAGVKFNVKPDSSQASVEDKYKKVAYVLGNAKVTETDSSYIITDTYDFNNYYEHPEQYTLKAMPDNVKKAVSDLSDGNLVQGGERLANYLIKAGYKGYPVKIVVPKTIPNVAKKVSRTSNRDVSNIKNRKSSNI